MRPSVEGFFPFVIRKSQMDKPKSPSEIQKELDQREGWFKSTRDERVRKAQALLRSL